MMMEVELAKIFVKSVFMALSWHFEPLRFGCRRSCFRLRHFYRIMLINSRFDNVHPVVRSRPLIEAKVSLYVFTIKLSRKTSGRRKLETSGNVPCSRFNYPSCLRLLFLRPTPSPLSSTQSTHPLDSFILLKYVLLLSALVSIMTSLSLTSFLCSRKNQSY